MIGRTNAQSATSSFINSYAITENGDRIDFDLWNTSFDTFSWVANISIIMINGIALNRPEIKFLFFGDSYQTSVVSGNGFLRGYTNLIGVTFQEPKEITSFPAFSFRDCSSIIELDLSSLVELRSVGQGFMGYCVKLQTIKMGAETPPIASATAADFLTECVALKTIYVPNQSVNAYKSAIGWRLHSSKIRGY